MRTYATAFYGNHLWVERRDGRPVRCQWDVLWRIKNEMAGPDTTLVEVYPATVDLVNAVNRRHLFEVDPNELKRLGAWICQPGDYIR